MGKKLKLKVPGKPEWWQPEGYDVRFLLRQLSGPTRRRITREAGAVVVGRHGTEILKTMVGKVASGEFVMDELVREAVVDWEGVTNEETGEPIPFSADAMTVLFRDCEDDELLNVLREHVHAMGEPIAAQKKTSDATPSSTSPESSPDETRTSSGPPSAASGDGSEPTPTPAPALPALPDGVLATPAPPAHGCA